MANPRYKTKSKRSRARKPRTIPPRRKQFATVRRPRYNTVTYINSLRTILAMLPLSSPVKGLFDCLFNLINYTIAQHSYNTGAYLMFKLTPATLLKNSPLLAKDGEKYTFPGYPVSVQDVHFKIINTSKVGEHSGRWAAVFIPYREEHDDKQMTNTLKDLSFGEVSAMPYAVTRPASEPIVLNFRMRDRTMYCARPRELTEAIGLINVTWDNGSRDNFESANENSTFNCEIILSGGCRPHTIFGPTHRVSFDAKAFDVQALTNGKTVRVHHEDGRVEHQTSGDIDFDLCLDSPQ